MKITDMNWMQVERYLQSDDRAVVPIGSGYYQRSDAEMFALWRVAVEETRAVIEGPWS